MILVCRERREIREVALLEDGGAVVLLEDGAGDLVRPHAAQFPLRERRDDAGGVASRESVLESVDVRQDRQRAASGRHGTLVPALLDRVSRAVRYASEVNPPLPTGFDRDGAPS